MAGDWNSHPVHLTENSLCGKRLGLLNLMEVWMLIGVEPGYCNRSRSLKIAVLKMHEALILEKKINYICMCPCSKIKPSPCRHNT